MRASADFSRLASAPPRLPVKFSFFVLMLGCYAQVPVPLPEPPPIAKTVKPVAEVRAFTRKVPPVHVEWLVVTLPSERAGATISNRLEKDAMATAKEFVEMTQKAKADRDNPAWSSPDEWELKRTCRTTMLRASLVSVRCDQYDYSGGAHGMEHAYSHTWRITGDDADEVALGDLFVPPWLETVDAACLDSLRRQEAMWVVDGSLKTVADMLHTWNVTREGLTFAFNPYEAGPYAQGPMDAILPYSALTKVIRRPGPLDSIAPTSAP